MALNRRWQIQVMRSQRKFARPEQTLTLQMNTDKKPPKPAFLNLNIPSLGEAEESGCDVSLGPHNLCPSVSICGFPLYSHG